MLPVAISKSLACVCIVVAPAIINTRPPPVVPLLPMSPVEMAGSPPALGPAKSTTPPPSLAAPSVPVLIDPSINVPN